MDESTTRGGVFDVVVVGAGFAGLYALQKARQEGLDAVAVEAGEGVGGTWYWNRYPGARCDVESVDYSYSFDADLERTWRWSERYATQPEILAYLSHVAERFELLPHIRFGRRVVRAVFDEQLSLWTLTADTGESFRSRFVIMATGCLSAPIRPDLPGIDDFAGETYFTAQWPHEPVGFAGKRVGLIGTGSSGIQVAPIIAAEAESLTVFQRSANYTVPAPHHPLTEEDQQRIREEYPARRAKSYYAPAGTPHEAYPKKATEIGEQERCAALEARWREGGVLFGKTFPDQNVDIAANDFAREFAEDRIREIVEDPLTADDLIPTDHPIGTKRIVTDSGYYAMFNRDNVHLVNLRRESVREVTSWGIKTDTASYELDVLVFATGFDALTGALTRIDIQGARGARIADVWSDGPLTYLGLGIPGFPNLLTLSGPGSPSVLANMVLHAQQQVDWCVQLVVECLRGRVSQVEPRYDAAEKWTEHLGEVADGTLFTLAGSWYMGANVEGKKRVFMPYIGGFGNYRRICDQVSADGYEGFVLTHSGPPENEPAADGGPPS